MRFLTAANLLSPSFAAQRALAGTAAWSFLAAAIGRGSNLAAVVICARVLSQEEFGQVALIQSTVGMFGPLAGLGLATTTTKFLAEYRDTDPARAGRILALSLAAAGAAGLLLTGVLILLAPALATYGFAASNLSSQLIQASGLLAFGVFEAVQTGVLTGLEAFPRLARLSVWNGLLSIPSVSFLAYFYGASGAIAGLTLAVILSCLLNAVVLRAECRKWGIRPTFTGANAERGMLFAFSLPSYLSGIIVAPVTWLSSSWLVHQPGGFAEMALFSAADRFRFLLIFLPLAVSRIAVPALSRSRATGDQDGYQNVFRWNLAFGLLATLPAALVCLVLSQPLMALFGEAFRRGWPVLAILALSAIPTVMNTQLGAALLSNGHAWARASADVVLAVVFLGSAWFFVPLWQATGLALSFAISYSTACLMLAIFLRRPHAVR
ncbi:MAG: oligosaccharide flippase family protein [Bryobacteraceae bacterium]|nr:oligosaccharide flippase family protein [Bryobacteraceae bacterium]